MRFSVFVLLLVATFVESGDSVVIGKTDSLDDRTYDSIKVRRLRGNDDTNEERNEPLVEVVSHGMAAATSSTSAKYVDMTADEIKSLAAKISETHNLHKLSNTDISKVMAELAAMKKVDKVDKKSWSMITKVFIAILAGISVSFALSALYELLTPYGA